LSNKFIIHIIFSVVLIGRLISLLMHITLQSRFAVNNSLLMRSNAASVNMARFPELSENDLPCLLESKNSENTKQATKNAML
jgi:hypothetical protein